MEQNKKLDSTNITEPKNGVTCVDMEVEVSSRRGHLFFQFDCPACGQGNVLSKYQKDKSVLCCQTYCKRVIILKEVSKAA